MSGSLYLIGNQLCESFKYLNLNVIAISYLLGIVVCLWLLRKYGWASKINFSRMENGRFPISCETDHDYLPVPPPRRPHRNRQYTDHFATLPDELLLMIYQNLPRSDVKSCALVCKRWNTVAYDERLRLFTDNKIMELSTKRKELPFPILKTAILNGLNDLSLLNTTITDPDCWNDVFPRNFESKLKSMSLWYTRLSEKCLLLLLHISPNLVFLLINGQALNENICKAIGQLPHLYTLFLNYHGSLDPKDLPPYSRFIPEPGEDHFFAFWAYISEDGMYTAEAFTNYIPAYEGSEDTQAKEASEQIHAAFKQLFAACPKLKNIIFWSRTGSTEPFRHCITHACPSINLLLTAVLKTVTEHHTEAILPTCH